MKLLHLDLETSPNLGHIWSLWNQNISLAQLRESSRMMCFAAKFVGEKKVHFFSEFHDGKDEMLEAAWRLIDEADVIGHYNGSRFDMPTLNKEFILSGMNPPSPYRQVDYLNVVKKRFRFPSNKLEYVAGALDIGSKVKHSGHDLWVRCLAGDHDAWAEMKKYNIQDVKLLDKLHDKLLPWIPNYPNVGMYAGVEDTCPNCGSEDLQRRGYSYTKQGQFQRYRCVCGTWSRGTKRLLGTSIITEAY